MYMVLEMSHAHLAASLRAAPPPFAPGAAGRDAAVRTEGHGRHGQEHALLRRRIVRCSPDPLDSGAGATGVQRQARAVTAQPARRPSCP
jgi:hypothetical protein